MPTYRRKYIRTIKNVANNMNNNICSMIRKMNNICAKDVYTFGLKFMIVKKVDTNNRLKNKSEVTECALL